jgi:hypothetical protein
MERAEKSRNAAAPTEEPDVRIGDRIAYTGIVHGLNNVWSGHWSNAVVLDVADGLVCIEVLVIHFGKAAKVSCWVDPQHLL